MNRTDRLLAIVLLLQSHRVLRAQEIADHFEICVRTAYRDLRALEEAGVPLCAEPGIGYSLVKEYHLPPVMFTHEEASALTIGGKFVEQLTDEALKKNMQTALLKIYSVLPRDKQIYLSTLQATTQIIPRSMTTLGENSNKITQLQEAIARQKVVKISYFAYYNQKETQRNIEPAGLLYYGDNWHLIAWCRLRNDYRDFRLNRIRELKTLESDFLARPNFNLADYVRTLNDVKNAIEVKVKFPIAMTHFIRNREFFGFVEEKTGAKFTTMTFLIESLPWMAHWLLSYGAAAEVISPESLKSMIKKEAQNVLDNYNFKKK
ncbi:MAG: YafY family transcriptional regulator [Calditrichaeota bacterium]|nr:MAG: YafY family transcriptional regulator [Calditrichota bacterium]